jgi:hypothetical protein
MTYYLELPASYYSDSNDYISAYLENLCLKSKKMLKSW